MSERSKEAVLKTVEARVSGGSNPSLSAKIVSGQVLATDHLSVAPWRGARAAESGSLLRSCTGNGTGGSNPPLSVFLFFYSSKLFS